MRSVNFKILPQFFIFSIISAYILFLLYLAKKNKLEVFLNYLTNKAIQKKLVAYHLFNWRYNHLFLLYYILVYTLAIESFINKLNKLKHV